MTNKIKSPKKSFNGWSLWEFVKGRRVMAVTVVATIAGYLAMDQAMIGFISGPILEGIWSCVDYWYNERK